MSRSGAEIRASEWESKQMQDRITHVEKHLGQLCDTFGAYARKTARLRDKGDLLCKDITEYAEYEKWNPTLRKGLADFAASLSAVQDYREAQVNRLEKKVVYQLSGYGILCKQTKNDLKGSFSAQAREMAQRKKLEQMKTKTPQNRQLISKAEDDLQKASINASQSQMAVEQQMNNFEAKKIRDMKNLLREFVNIELIFHAKALELYTHCFKTLDVVDPERDLEEFRKQIQPANAFQKQLVRTASQQSKASNSESATPAVARHPPQPTRIPVPAANMASGVQREKMEADSEEDDEDASDEEEDDDDESYYTEGESTARSSNARRQ